VRRVAAVIGLAGSLLLAPGGWSAGPEAPQADGEFHFARMIYDDRAGRNRFRGGWWRQDFPEAEEHFTTNLKRLTRVDAGEPVQVRLTDDALFDNPWLYATQTGYWELDDAEVARLREYLLRGGFFMADDYWGEDERDVFERTMSRVFPDRPIKDMPQDDAVLHVVFSIDEFTQIPGLRHISWGDLSRLPPPRWRGIYDDNGRLMIGMNYNQDVGDSWEEANNPQYPEPMTALGYRFGVNYVIYAMTH
jgi:hypothetical protein